MLNLAQLEAFVAIVDMQGFRGAAERLGCSQPTISQQLRKLEEMLGATLVVRDRSQSTPTPSGARLLPLARSLLNAASRTRDVVTATRLTVGASSNIGIYLLQPFVARFAREYGGTTGIDLRIATNPEIAACLSIGEVDIGVMEWWDQRKGFSATRWRRERLMVIVAPEHPWAKKKTVQPSQLFEEPMIGGETGTGTGTLLQKVFGKNAAKMRISLTVGSTEAVKEAVKAGLGISLVFASAVDEEVRAESLRALPVLGVDIAKDLFVILPDQTPAESPTQRFANLLTDAHVQHKSKSPRRMSK
jgi:DNA-binding transcriptional LysR family regulator